MSRRSAVNLLRSTTRPTCSSLELTLSDGVSTTRAETVAPIWLLDKELYDLCLYMAFPTAGTVLVEHINQKGRRSGCRDHGLRQRRERGRRARLACRPRCRSR
jgi:hypothetical protein